MDNITITGGNLGVSNTTLGQYALLAPASSTRNVIQPTGDYVPLTLKGSSSQTAHLFDIKNSSSTSLVSVTKDGFLGLHVASPTYLIDTLIPGDATMNFKVDASGLDGFSANFYMDADITHGGNGTFIFKDNGTNVGVISAAKGDVSEMSFASKSNYDLAFYTTDSFTERMRITSADGFVGIGQPAPAYPVDVLSTVIAGLRLKAGNIGNGVQATLVLDGDVTNGGGDQIAFKDNGTLIGVLQASKNGSVYQIDIGGAGAYDTVISSNIAGSAIEAIRIKSTGSSQVKAGGSTGSIAKLGGTIFDHFANAGNSTTTETDLYSDTVPASVLGSNGDKLQAEYGGVFVSSGTATREVKIYFAGTAIFDTGALTLSLSAAWTVYASLIRVSSTVVRYMISLTTEGAALSAYTAVGELTGLTLSNTNVLKITGQAAGVGAATNDIVAKMGTVSFQAAA